MKHISILLIFLSVPLFSQQDLALNEEDTTNVYSNTVTLDSSVSNLKYPEGFYTTLEAFKNKVPNWTVEEFQFAQHKKSKLHYCFLDSEGKNLKKYFAVSYDGNLYINISNIISNRKFGGAFSGNYGTSVRNKCWYYKAGSLGDKTEVYGLFHESNGGLVGGLVGGLIGSAIGSAIDASSAIDAVTLNPSQGTVPTIYDDKLEGFVIIGAYSLLKRFIKKHYPESTTLLEKVKEESRKKKAQRENKYVFIRSILKELK